jgi:hypothetical protein
MTRNDRAHLVPITPVGPLGRSHACDPSCTPDINRNRQRNHELKPACLLQRELWHAHSEPSRAYSSLRSTTTSGLAITLDREPPALPSTRNRSRTAVRQGASWTAAYHRQLTVAAVARPVRGSVGALGVLAAERSWSLLAQTASARRSVQPVSRARTSPPWSTRPAGTPRRRSPVSSRRCPPIRFGRPGSGCPAVRYPVTWGRRPEVRRLAVCCPPIQRPAVWCPAVWCLPRLSGRVRLLPPQAVVLGPRSSWPGDRDHRYGRYGWRPCGCRAVDGSTTVGEAGTWATLPTSRWSVGGR